eukprot:381971-Prorocentrum_minimum.AAC.4
MRARAQPPSASGTAGRRPRRARSDGPRSSGRGSAPWPRGRRPPRRYDSAQSPRPGPAAPAQIRPVSQSVRQTEQTGDLQVGKRPATTRDALTACRTRARHTHRRLVAPAPPPPLSRGVALSFGLASHFPARIIKIIREGGRIKFSGSRAALTRAKYNSRRGAQGAHLPHAVRAALVEVVGEPLPAQHEEAPPPPAVVKFTLRAGEFTLRAGEFAP